MLDDVSGLDLHDAARLLFTRELSPVDLTRAVLDRIEWLNPHLEAFITVTADEALQAAREAERDIAKGSYRGPLHGIPVALKDNIATAGIRTTAASRRLANWVPVEDAACWARLRDAGAVLVGKTNLHEYAMAGSLFAEGYGAARNPWDLTRTTNGSSSGSGSAVAAGLSFAALGTETGASLLRPAAFCGLVGIRATYSWVSRAGIVNNSWGLDHIGPLTRSVRDAAFVLQTLLGYDPRDPGSIRTPVPDLVAQLGGSLAGLRIGVPWSHIIGTVDPEVESAFRLAVEVFRDGGAEIVELDLPLSSYAAACSTIISRIEATTYHAPFVDREPDGYSPMLQRVIATGRQLSAEEYLLAQRARRVIGNEIATVYERVDVIAGPTTATAATPLALGFGPMGDRPLEIGHHASNLHRLPSLLGLPAISVPCGFTAGGLPIGMRLQGWRLAEATVLRAAAAFESRTDWQRLPTLNLNVEKVPPPPPQPPSSLAGGYTPELEALREAVRRLTELGLDFVEPATVYRPVDEW